MKNFLFILVVTILAEFSCNNETKSSPETIQSLVSDSVSDKTFSTDWKILTKDFMTWYNYTYYNIHLSQDFIGIDIESQKIDKATFLNKLMTENVIAFKTKIIRGQSVYQLFKLNSSDESIKATIKQMASTEIKHFRMEGIDVPEFNFTDLNGKLYNKSSTKGKIVILKCWFIHCTACIKEFPELNKLVEEYLSRNDILFISLALDSKKELIKFFETKDFKYATIPEMENYMTNKLNVTEYPTHILVDRNGKIIKVVNRIEDMIPFLKNETEKTTL